MASAAGGAPVRGAEAGDVWVVVEQHDGVAAEVSLELLGRARELAERLGVGIGAVLAGAGAPVRALAPGLVARGADTVYLADHEALAHYLALPYTAVVSHLVREHRPQIVLYGATTTGRDLAPRVASTLRTGLTADCTDLRIGDFTAKGQEYADLLYQIINKRYLRASTVVTTNLAFKEWGNLFHNAAAATAIADRLVHKGLLVRIAGKSSRPGSGGDPSNEAA